MKKSIGMVLVSLGTIFSACGTNKSKKTPAPDHSEDQVSNGQQGPVGGRGETGGKGDKGDRGPSGPGISFPYLVADGNGVEIGSATWDGFTKFNQGVAFSFESFDGAIFAVNATTGFYAGGAYCLYAANDCSGTCLYPVNPGSNNVLVQGKTSFFWLKTSTPRTQQSYSSYSVDNGTGGTSCGVAGGPIQEWLVAVPGEWAKPQGFVYPIPVPLSLVKTP
jgi:hypothetical protein